MTEQQAATVADDLPATPVGQRIRARRLELGLSQAEIAEGMLSPSYVSLVESGRRQPAASALAHIAERLRIDVEFLRDGVDASVRTRARLALGRAEVALQQGQFDEAFRQFDNLVGDRGLNDEQSRQARLGRALASERLGDIEGAIRMLGELADEARQAPAVQSWLDVALALTRCYREVGDLDMAIQIGEEAMRSALDLGLEGTDEHIRLGSTLLAAYYNRGDAVRSRQLAADLVSLADRTGAPYTRGAAYWNASLVAESRGDLALALNLVDRALAMFGESDDRRNLARLRMTYAWLLMQGEDPRPQEALELLEGAHDDIVTYAAVQEIGDFEAARAEALLRLGRLDAARDAADQAMRSLGEKPRIGSAHARLVLARVLHGQGEIEECVRQAAVVADELASMGSTRAAATVWRELGDLYRDLGRSEDALVAYDGALRAMRVAPKSGVSLVAEVPDSAATAESLLGAR